MITHLKTKKEAEHRVINSGLALKIYCALLHNNLRPRDLELITDRCQANLTEYLQYLVMSGYVRKNIINGANVEYSINHEKSLIIDKIKILEEKIRELRGYL